MNKQQELFCKLYVESNCTKAIDAYLQAGYEAKDRKVASSSANRLLLNARIKEKIQQLYAEREKELMKIAREKIMDTADKRAFLARVISDPAVNMTDKLKAVDIDNKMSGEYISKTQITGADGGALAITWEGVNSGGSCKEDNNSL